MTALLLAVLLGHGVPAQTLSVTTRPGTDGDLLVSTTFGAVLSHDRGASWHVICEEAIGYGAGQRPAWWLQPGLAMFAGSYKGLFVAPTDGCTWQSVPDFDSTGCSDLKGQGSTLLATSGKYGVTNRIMRSTDLGATWTPSSESSAVLFYSSVRLAPSNPQRVYAAGWWFDPYSSWWFRSDDNGQTFTRLDLSTQLPAAGAFYVLAVHPTKPEVVFASVSRDTDPAAGWLLKSTDSGNTFSPVITAGTVFNTVAFGSDPSIVYAAAGPTLYRSNDEGSTFTALPAPVRNACVTTRGEDVYACGQQELDGWSVAHGTGGELGALLKWSGIAGPLSCPAGSPVQTLCEPLWPVVQATFPLEPDAGAPDGGGAGGGGAPQPGKKCGCSSVEAPLGLAALLIVRRRARRS